MGYLDLQGRRVLVTGAAGFVGANLARGLLARGARVYAQVRPGADLWRLLDLRSELHLMPLDISNHEETYETVSRLNPEYVFHMAVNRQRDDWQMLFETNVTATINLIRASASSSLKHFVHAGGSLEYGDAVCPYREVSLPQPTSFYGASKAAATLLALQVASEHGVPLKVLRFFHVYGPWEPHHRLVPTAIRAALQRCELELTSPGFRHDYVFVEDVVDACLIAAGSDCADGTVVNVGSGQQWTNEAVVDLVEAISGCIIKRKVGSFPARDADKMNWVADVTLARELFGWEAKYSLRSGLERTFEWMRKNDQEQ